MGMQALHATDGPTATVDVVAGDEGAGGESHMGVF